MRLGPGFVVAPRLAGFVAVTRAQAAASTDSRMSGRRTSFARPSFSSATIVNQPTSS
jgi:hypothetical protein